MNTYKRPNLFSPTAAAATLYDHRGSEYLDFLGGIAVNALGYAHPRIVRTIRREAGAHDHVSNLFHNPFQGPLAAQAREMVGHGPRVFHEQRLGSDRRRR